MTVVMNGESGAGLRSGEQGGGWGAAAHQPQPGALRDRLQFGVPVAMAFCAAWRGWRAADGPGVEGWGGSRVGPLREVGPEEQEWTRGARDPPVPRPGPLGGLATGQAAGDGGGQVEGGEGEGEKAQGANAEIAAAEVEVVLKMAGDRSKAQRGSEGRGSVQGSVLNSTDHKE